MNVSYFTVMTATELLQSQAVAVVSAGLCGRELRSVGGETLKPKPSQYGGVVGQETGE